jgi:hypothetical protein
MQAGSWRTELRSLYYGSNLFVINLNLETSLPHLSLQESRGTAEEQGVDQAW